MLRSQKNEIMMVDFQLLQSVPFVTDLALFFAFNLDPINQDLHEEKIIQHYYNSMKENCKKNGDLTFIPFEEMMDYFHMMVWGISVSLVFFVTQPLNDSEKEREIIRNSVIRNCHFIERHLVDFEEVMKKYKKL
jgi:hypothetical protein